MRRSKTPGHPDPCRCEPCWRAKLAYDRYRYRMRAYGRPTTDLVDAEPVRAHVRSLMEAGVGWKRVAELAGVGQGVIQPLLWGIGSRAPTKRMRADNATRILAVQAGPDALRPGRKVPAVGTARRARALAVLGYSPAWQGAQIDLHRTQVQAIVRGDQQQVTVATERAMRRLFDAYALTWCTRRSAGRIRTWARTHGWAPPLAWDDDTIDDPSAQPRGVRREDAA